MGKGERYFTVVGRKTDSPRDILRTPADNSAAFRCILTRPVVDCHHSQITTEIQKVAKLTSILKDGPGRLAVQATL